LALLNVVNEIGRAIHKKKRKHHILGHQKSLWLDSKEPLEMALINLEGQKNVAEWFVGLDDEGFSFLSSPLYHQNKKQRTAGKLMQTDEPFSPSEYLAFQAEWGSLPKQKRK
jgi:hypothetical protein